MMRISNKQRAIINSAVKPFKITSNYLGTGLQNLIKYYTKYFTKRRFTIVHLLPAYKKLNSHILTVLFNTYLPKGGYAKKRRPLTWRFYGNILLTKYGRRKQRKEQKKKRKKVCRQKSNVSSKDTVPIRPSSRTSAATPLVLSDIESDSNGKSNDDVTEITSDTNESSTAATDDPDINNVSMIKDKTNSSEESTKNIWEIDIQDVAALIGEDETIGRQTTQSEFIQ